MKHLALITLALSLLVAPMAQADIIWNWVNAGSGTEAGVFITDGDLIGGLAPAGDYTLLDFIVSESGCGLPVGGLLSGEYSISQPTMGFTWNGAIPTVFWRSSGTYTNGFAFSVTNPADGAPDRIAFGIDRFVVDIYYSTVFIDEDQTIVLTIDADQTPVVKTTLGDIRALFR